MVRQATRRLIYPLLVDASMYSVGQWLRDAVLSGSLQNTTHWCGHVLATADVNGDGRTDQICAIAPEATIKVALATANGFAAPTTWLSGFGWSQFMSADANNDGKADFIIYGASGGQFLVALSTGTSFGSPVLWGTADNVWYNGSPHACKSAGQYSISIGAGDFNGDGITDVSCKVAGFPEAFIGLSNGSSSFTFSVFAQLSCEAYERTGSIDFDGDGKDDWYCIGVTTGSLLVFPSTGSSFAYPAFGSLTSSFCSDPYYVLGDFNGDGRTDAACTYNGKTALSTGRVFAVQAGAAPPWCSGAGMVAFASDVDGDGASEIVCNNTGAPANDIEVRKWKAEAWAPVEIWKASWCNATVHAGDFNGDGKTDLLCSALSAPVVAGTGGLRADLLGTAGNGLGGTVQVSYSSSVAFANTNNPPPKQVVTAVTRNNGLGGSATTGYSYAGGLMDRQERRFLGFHEVIQTLPCITGEESCPSVRTVLKQDLPSAGKPERVERRDGTGRILNVEEYEYTTNAPQIPRTSLLTSERSYSFDETGNGCTSWPCSNGKRTRATHQYDGFGNRTQTAAYGDEDGPNDETTFVWTFRPNASTYIVDRIAMQQQFAGIPSGAKLTERYFWYDGANTWDVPPTKGFVTASFDWLNWPQARYVGLFTDYDDWGNLISQADPTNRMTLRTYDSTYHLFPESVTIVGVPETEHTTWDPICSRPNQRIDANGQVTTMYSDNFCRPSVTNYPLGGYEIRQYLAFGDPIWQRVKVLTPSASPEDGTGDHFVAEHFDGLGRPYHTVSKGPTPTTSLIRDETYNARGQVASETAPYYAGQTIYTTTYMYDGFDRLTAVHFPDNNQMTKTYNLWRETTFDEHGHPTTSRFDAYGRTVQKEQLLSGQTLLTRYSYNLLGQLVAITDPLNNAWSWSFDSVGRSYSRSDPDSGTWTFEFDDAGRVAVQTDAKSQETEFTYDPAGRLATKINASGTVTVTRSEPRSGFFNVGRITTVSDASGMFTRDYDPEGRGVRQTRTLEGILYQAERRYDVGGHLRGITYPDSDAVGTPTNPLLYDATGRLKSIPGIIGQIQYDAAGRPTSQTNVNGTVTARTYSSRGFLTGVSTTGNSGTIQNLIYSPDSAGLVQSVTSSIANEYWSYGYDELHRLISANSVLAPAESQTFQYDSIGRMTYNSRLGTYTYPSSGLPRPHAPAVIAGGAYYYDANGNLFSGGNRTVQWNADNRVTQITRASTMTTFTYDAFGERVKKTAGDSTSLYPLSDDYEVTNGQITKYISMGGLGVIAKRVSGATYWLHTDGLGSIHAITDASGIVIQRSTYRPYGDKIGDLPSPPPQVESRGYIDQRQDTETGLTYLHARYYDSALGVFISPDPLHPAEPGVGLNRYVYSFGDPINNSDRGGLYIGDGDTMMLCWPEDTWDSATNTLTSKEVCSALPRGGGSSDSVFRSPLSSLFAEFRSQRGERSRKPGQQPSAGLFVPPGTEPGTEPPNLPTGGDLGGLGPVIEPAAVAISNALGISDLVMVATGNATPTEKAMAVLTVAMAVIDGPFTKSGVAAIEEAWATLKGTNAGIKEVGTAAEIEEWFARMSNGARKTPKAGYDGRFMTLPDGSTVGLRESTKYGPTIDIHQTGMEPWKIHIKGE